MYSVISAESTDFPYLLAQALVVTGVDPPIRGSGLTAGLEVLEASFPNHNVRSWNNTYLGLALIATSYLFEARYQPRIGGNKADHAARFKLLLQGANHREIAAHENISPHGSREWLKTFPPVLRKAVSYYDIVRSADNLLDRVEQVEVQYGYY